MARKRNRSPSRTQARPGETHTPYHDPPIPDAPPMQNRRLSWWPLIVIGVILLLWLIWLAVLASYSDRWRPS